MFQRFLQYLRYITGTFLIIPFIVFIVITCLRPKDVKSSSSFQIDYFYRPDGIESLKVITNGSVLHSGDLYKIIFTPDDNCYVYIFQVDSSGQIFQLFPMQEFKGVIVNNQNPVKVKKVYILPAPDKSFKLDKQVGRERFYFLAFKKKMKSWNKFVGICGEQKNGGI